MGRSPDLSAGVCLQLQPSKGSTLQDLKLCFFYTLLTQHCKIVWWIGTKAPWRETGLVGNGRRMQLAAHT